MGSGTPGFRVGVIALALAWSLAQACSDHSGLAETDAASSTVASSSGSGGFGGTGVTSSSASVGSGGTGAVEPPGPTALTIVNGVTDYDEIRLCVLGHPNGEKGDDPPWPAAPMPFAHGAAVDPISDLVPSGVDVRIHVLAGDLAQAAGKTCAEIVAAATPDGGAGGAGGSGGAPGPSLVVTALPVLPASVFQSDKSLLLVPAGCLGGPGHTDPAETLACGTAYTAGTPTGTLIAVAMSRITDPAHVSLQAAHASVGMQAVDIRITPGFDAAGELQLGSALSTGAIGPKPPFDFLDAAAYGILGQAVLKTYAPNDSTASSTIAMSEVLGNSEVAESDFVDGKGYVIVAVGAFPGLAGSWWNPLTYTLVRSDPAPR